MKLMIELKCTYCGKFLTHVCTSQIVEDIYCNKDCHDKDMKETK
jgi:hypothetical protein